MFILNFLCIHHFNDGNGLMRIFLHEGGLNRRIPVLVHALMAVKTGDDDYIGTAAGVTDAFNQSVFVLFVHKCFYFCFFAFLDGKEAFHSGTELDMVLIRQCPGLYPADFHHAVISAKCLVDLPDLFEFLRRYP